MPSPDSETDSRFLLTADWSNYPDMLNQREWKFKTPGEASNFRPGARGVIYLTGGSGPYAAAAAVVEAAGPAKPQASKLWPLVVPITLHVEARPPVPMRNLLAALSFVPTGSAWGLAFKGRGLRRIPLGDFNLLESQIMSAVRNPRGEVGHAVEL